MSEFHDKVAEFYRYSKGAKRKAAEFFLLHSDEVAFMTLEQISAQTGVSPSTVTRTATEIGYHGFPGLLRAARNSVRRDMAPLERLNRAPIPEGSSGFYESLETDRRNIETLFLINEAAVINRTVEMLAAASKVYLFTSRTSYGAMSFFAYVLGQIRPNVVLLTEAEGRLVDEMMDIAPDEVFFLADLPRYSKVAAACAREAHETACRLISVTDGPDSPIARYSDITLFVPYVSYSFFNTNVSTMALYNALATAVNLKLKDDSLPRLERHNSLLQRFKTLVMQKDARE